MIADGFVLGPLGIALYFLVIALWSAVVAYVVIFGNDSGGGHDAHAPASPVASSHGPSHHTPVEPTRAKPFRGFSPYEGFKSYAQGETVTVEDIVKGLARESGASALHEAKEMHEVKPASHDPAKAVSVAQVNAFLDLLVQGERDAVFDMLRDIEEHGEGAESFLTRVLSAVESALQARMNGGTCDIRIMEILGNCETPSLEKLAAALATGDTGKQGGKLALTRALGALKG